MQLPVNVGVDDQERAIKFYCGARGLQPGRRLFAGSAADLLGVSSRRCRVSRIAGTSDSAKVP